MNFQNGSFIFRFNNLTLREMVLNHEDDSISRIYRVLIFTDFEEIGVHRVPALFSLL